MTWFPVGRLGLALGGVALGRMADRLARLLRAYGFLEAGIAVAGLLLPVLLALVDRIYVASALQRGGTDWVLNLLRVVCAFAVLLIPTFFMGGTLPVLTRYVVGGARQFRPRLAFFGTFVSGFCALALEVMWTRGIGIAIGTTTYSFTIMLAAFLAGITLGSSLHAMVPLRRVHVALQFGVVLALIGISSAFVSQLVPSLPPFRPTRSTARPWFRSAAAASIRSSRSTKMMGRHAFFLCAEPPRPRQRLRVPSPCRTRTPPNPPFTIVLRPLLAIDPLTGFVASESLYHALSLPDLSITGLGFSHPPSRFANSR